MQLTSTISPYDHKWPHAFRDEATRLSRVFGSALRELHHVGSTAVPGLSAKPEIDVLAVVDDVSLAGEWAGPLAKLKYRRGGDLSEGHLFYKRDVEGVRTHKIHVCQPGHPKIGEMLNFRDYLRSQDGARREYETLKLQLEQQNTTGIAEYLQGKEPFIRAALLRAGSK
jgi:GrpB-like predicted nucleotidyltransferase (UPF0157 family)